MIYRIIQKHAILHSRKNLEEFPSFRTVLLDTSPPFFLQPFHRFIRKALSAQNPWHNIPSPSRSNLTSLWIEPILKDSLELTQNCNFNQSPFHKFQMGCRRKTVDNRRAFRRQGSRGPTSPRPCCAPCSGWSRGPGTRGCHRGSTSDRWRAWRTRSPWSWDDLRDPEVNFPAWGPGRRWTRSGGSPRRRRSRRCRRGQWWRWSGRR